MKTYWNLTLPNRKFARSRNLLSRGHVYILFILLTLSLVACSLGQSRGESPNPNSGQLQPSPAPSQTARASLESPAPSAPAGSAALAACPVDNQALAMGSQYIPDWTNLSLSACYDLSLDLDLENKTYRGTATVTYANLTGEDLPDLVFRTYPNSRQIYGGQLDVTSAAVNGVAVSPQVFLSDRTGLRIPLQQPLPAGDSRLVQLEFNGAFPVDFGGLSDVYGIFNYVSQEQVLTLADWYPLLAPRRNGAWEADAVVGIGDAVVSQVALYKVQINAPADWQLITTGSQVSQDQVQGPGFSLVTPNLQPSNLQSSTSFVSGPAREFILLASPNFTLREDRVGGVNIRHWGLPDGEPRWDEALQATVESLSLYDERFGPYPYAELDVVAVPLKRASGVEYPGVFLLGASQYEQNTQRPFLLGLVASHEAAHQWWYGVVGSDVLLHPWQDEALATFSSLLYQQIYQPRSYPGTLQFYEQTVSEVDQGSGNTSVDQPVDAFTDHPNEYSPIVYDKGALFFVNLRDKLGDQIFFDALRSYYSHEQYKIASPADLLGAFESSCSCDLSDFYAQWGVE
ncbi:MAG: M1 family metallopeptidase [Anaerolineales bacterium]